MTERPFYVNPFRVVSPKVDAEVLRLRELRAERVSESTTLQEGLLIMIGKLIEVAEALSHCVFTCDKSVMDHCESLAEEVDEEEKTLTRYLISSGVSGDMMRGIIRFPYRLERIGDLLETILHCCRVKARDSVEFSHEANEELNRLFGTLLDTMLSLREGFVSPNESLLQSIIAQGQRLAKMVDDSRSAHWERIEGDICTLTASSTYREILDSINWINEYLIKMATTLLELGVKMAESESSVQENA